MANIGAGLLDAMSGINASNAMIDGREDRAALLNQRAQQEKRQAMADEVAQGGLEDYRRTRTTDAAAREAFAAAPDQATGLAAVEATRRKGGDVAGAQKASADRVMQLVNEAKAADEEFTKKYRPELEAFKVRQIEQQKRNAPLVETLQDQELKNRVSAGMDNVHLRTLQLLVTDKAAALKFISESPNLFPGQKVTDILVSADGGEIAFVGEKGEKLGAIPMARAREMLQQAQAPKKLEVLKPGETGFTLNPQTGKYEQQVSVDPANKYVALPENSPGTLNTTTGATSAGPGLSSGMSPQRQDARFRVAEQVIGNALGGSFDAIGKLSLKPGTEAIYQRATVLAEEAIKAGADPAQAASKAVDQAMREAKTGGAVPALGLPAAQSSVRPWQ